MSTARGSLGKRPLTKEEEDKIIKETTDPRILELIKHDSNPNLPVNRVMELARKVFPDNWISVEGTSDPTIVDFVHEERMTRNYINCQLSDTEITDILISIKEGTCPGRTDAESATQAI